jgi:hypothetical protein
MFMKLMSDGTNSWYERTFARGLVADDKRPYVVGATLRGVIKNLYIDESQHNVLIDISCKSAFGCCNCGDGTNFLCSLTGTSPGYLELDITSGSKLFRVTCPVGGTLKPSSCMVQIFDDYMGTTDFRVCHTRSGVCAIAVNNLECINDRVIQKDETFVVYYRSASTENGTCPGGFAYFKCSVCDSIGDSTFEVVGTIACVIFYLLGVAVLVVLGLIFTKIIFAAGGIFAGTKKLIGLRPKTD